MDIREILARAPVIPVLTVAKLEHAMPLARALVAGGLGVLEITLRTPCALDAIEAMRAAVPDAIVGVGTLTRPEEFAEAERVGYTWPTHEASATSSHRARILAVSRAGRGPLASRDAFCCQRSGLAVPTMAVCTPGTQSVKRSAAPTPESDGSRRKG